MSKPFDYSKWDNIELSDDEEDCHPNIDKESWFRLKHRSRVEREDNEEKEKKRIREEMEKANQRMKLLEHNLAKIQKDRAALKTGEDDDDDDDDLDETEGLLAELKELRDENASRQKKLDDYEKNKKWNTDNMFQVKEERTVINPAAGKDTFTSSGFVKPKEELNSGTTPEAETPGAEESKKPSSSAKKSSSKPSPASKPTPAAATKSPQAAVAKPVGPTKQPKVEVGSMETYHEFTEKYAETVELFMQIPDLEGSREFLLKYGDIILQENASNYLLLASLEDEMNGYHEKMRLVARQSQIISSIAEMAKTLNTHPGNVIMPFFNRLQQRQYLEDFMAGVKVFVEKVKARAVVKKAEIDAQRLQEAEGNKISLDQIPLEERLGPGGLDPVEVIESLPQELVECFETRNVEKLKEVLTAMDPKDAEYHMKRCIDSGLWVSNA